MFYFQVLLFAEVCCVRLSSETCKRSIREAHDAGLAKSGGGAEAAAQSAAKKCLDIQYSTFELMGIDRAFGVAQLNRAGASYAGDEEVVSKMQMFAGNCQAAVSQAGVTKEQMWAEEVVLCCV